MTASDSPKLTWLTVGGCPRSGTTALGEALNRHPDIALWHEYDAAHFFASVGALFREEDRLGAYVETGNFEFIPRSKPHELPIIQAIFELVCGRRTPVIGTKFPGAHLWPKPLVPTAMHIRELHISRAPAPVILSYVAKMQREAYPGTSEHIFDTALAHWILAWNYAVFRGESAEFLHVQYGDLAGNERLGQEIARFLGVEGSIDLEGFESRDRDDASCMAELEAMGFGGVLWKLKRVSEQWEAMRNGALPSASRFGFPVGADARIVLRSGDAWRAVTDGFLPAEPDGAWVGGQAACVYLIPERTAGRYLVTLEVPWNYQPDDIPPALSISIDDGPALDVLVALEDGQGGAHRKYSWIVPVAQQQSPWTACLKIVPLNPRNPSALSDSPDDRLLSVMVSSIRVSPL